MEEANIYLDVPSPSNSFQYLYGDRDHDHYLDANHSESHSSAPSPYDMTFSGDFSGATAFSSPDSRDADEGSESPLDTSASTTATETQPKPAAKRKRENRYKNAPPSVLSRRRAQNRASQRAYRERKDQRIKDLEQMLSEARARNDVLGQAFADLQAEYAKLKSSSSPVSATTAHLRVHSHSHSHHHLDHHLNAVAASLSPPTSYASHLGTAGFIDPTSMAVLNAGNDLDAYLYPNVTSYVL